MSLLLAMIVLSSKYPPDILVNIRMGIKGCLPDGSPYQMGIGLYVVYREDEVGKCRGHLQLGSNLCLADNLLHVQISDPVFQYVTDSRTEKQKQQGKLGKGRQGGY